MVTLSNSCSNKAQQSFYCDSVFTINLNFSTKAAMNEGINYVYRIKCYINFLIPREIMILNSLNTNVLIINSINSNNTNNTLNKNKNVGANWGIYKCHMVLGLKPPSPPSREFEFACCLNRKEEVLFKLKWPPPLLVIMNLHVTFRKREKHLRKVIWTKFIALTILGKRRKQPKITMYLLNGHIILHEACDVHFNIFLFRNILFKKLFSIDALNS